MRVLRLVVVGHRDGGLHRASTAAKAPEVNPAGDSALQGVSLTVEAGEVVAVTGPSGSGKSTLLACLVGLDEPDGGMVKIDGERHSRRPEEQRARVRGRGIAGRVLPVRSGAPTPRVGAAAAS